MEDYRTKLRLREIEILEKNRGISLLTKELNLSKEKNRQNGTQNTSFKSVF